MASRRVWEARTIPLIPLARTYVCKLPLWCRKHTESAACDGLVGIRIGPQINQNMVG